MARRQSRPSIREVAKEAGVSVTTVSHALNGKGRLDTVTRERVIEVANRMGYHPNRNARGLRSGRTDTIALLLPLAPGRRRQPIEIDFYLELLTASVDAAFQHDQALVQLPPLESAGDLHRFALDGGIVVDPVRDDPRVAMFHDLELPLVTVGNHDARPHERWTVIADSAGTTRTMCDHMAAKGAQRIGMLTVDIDWSWFTDGIAAYQGWCADHGQEPILSLARRDKQETSMRDAVARLLDRPDPPDAVFVPPQWLASGLLTVAGERGITVPGDMIIGVGVDSGLARGTQPPLTAVDLNAPVMAQQAVDLLMKQIAGEPAAPRFRVVPTTLLPRESTSRVGVRPRGPGLTGRS
ncbi:DNA-binding LacI/PurR family transcriptional regulator [Kibdelosporangium banguiense]|uniref:DNA-binding LacI/PurR family transcriptional regulator n=1 Tax=Kibdelosporangium banguiense TaxID=1365924 RepID=A0ABS4TGL9_9PSEU|nr:LacI family DNA-binding transcriptional regulator [Kibdelosporangium banguiense]MBP2323578.1 DNA-binding LacI/PurR family transcriptional regulator [Kibdelosporangium banguiense]